MESEEIVFLDTNVILDHLADRQPFAEFAHRVLALAEKRQLKICVSALSIANLYYILRKSNGHAAAISLLKELMQLVAIVPFGKVEIDESLRLNAKDFEDGIQYASAQAIPKISGILTRDKTGFPVTGTKLLTPEEFLATRS